MNQKIYNYRPYVAGPLKVTMAIILLNLIIVFVFAGSTTKTYASDDETVVNAQKEGALTDSSFESADISTIDGDIDAAEIFPDEVETEDIDEVYASLAETAHTYNNAETIRIKLEKIDSGRPSTEDKAIEKLLKVASKYGETNWTADSMKRAMAQVYGEGAYTEAQAPFGYGDDILTILQVNVALNGNTYYWDPAKIGTGWQYMYKYFYYALSHRDKNVCECDGMCRPNFGTKATNSAGATLIRAIPALLSDYNYDPYTIDRGYCYCVYWALAYSCSMNTTFGTMVSANGTANTIWDAVWSTSPTSPMTEGVEIVTPATCTSDGLIKYTCITCGGGEYTETIPALGHSYDSKVVSPTYETKGYTLHTCTKCGDSYKDSVVAKLKLPQPTGFAKLGDSWLYYKDGKRTSYTGLIKGIISDISSNAKWYYVENGIFAAKSGLAKKAEVSSSKWYYVLNGVYTKASGLAKKADGSSDIWYYVLDGVYTKASGLARKADGSSARWYYVLNGVYTKASGLAKKADGSSDIWYYVLNGVYKKSSGIAKKADGSSSKWYYVQNGVYKKATGIAKKADGSSTEWYYVQNGTYNKSTVIAKKADGSSSAQYYVCAGKFTKKTGYVKINGIKYYLVNGKVS